MITKVRFPSPDQDLATEHHLSMAGKCQVDVMEVITFLLPATGPFGANLSVEDADEVDSQSFQQVKLNVSRLSVENGSPNCAGSCAGRVFKFHDFALKSDNLRAESTRLNQLEC